ncbi:hypothetical protein LJB99_04720 [Deltaproteobacteria bacterium OttesenSCG-928-K17]|nr:hypothetical protein [Deltaproteobacteria bacterium OttesenSCG-928-K17]
MATAIPIAAESHPQPACDQASCCYWFEKTGALSTECANRDSMICRKRRDDVFAPHERKRRAEG